MKGVVPTPDGEVDLYVSTSQIKVKSTTGTGTLKIKSKVQPKVKGANIIAKGNNLYELTLQPNTAYEVNYKAI